MQFLLIILVCADKAYSSCKWSEFVPAYHEQKNARFFQNKQKVQIKRAKYAKNRHIENKIFELVPPWKKSKKTPMVAKHTTWIKRLT